MGTAATSPEGGIAMAGLVLCGGQSVRMGVDKATIEVGGEPLVQRVAREVAGVADPVLLATGRPGRFGPLGFPEVADERAEAGPLGGIVAGLAASPHELLAVVAVDLPFASGSLLGLLARLHGDEDVVAPVSDCGVEPLHAVYARRALPGLRAALEDGTWSVRGALSRLRVREVEEQEWRPADPTGRFGCNLNRVADLAMLHPGQHRGGSSSSPR